MHYLGNTNGHAPTHGPRIAAVGPADRLPPYNAEAEAGVVGAILLDNAVLPDVAALVEPADFFRDDLAIIYRTILDLASRGVPADGITVGEELARRGLYESVGGIDAIAAIFNAVPHAANATYHAQIVREKAVVRGLIESADEIGREGYANNRTAQELVGRAKARLDRLAGKAEAEIAPDPTAVATLADVRRVAGEASWLWPGWLIDAHMTVLAAAPGVGKTRLTMDLCRRLWNAVAWPDDEMATRPPGTCSLWVASDRNHSEIVKVASQFGLPDDSIRFNAPPVDPCGGLKLDDPADVRDLARRVEAVRPGLLVIDTVNKATKRLLYRPEEAEAFFGPLLDVARDTRTPILALTHLSKAGEPLDRRIEGICRVMWKLERPDPDGQPNRRKLWVDKSNDLYPAPRGVTMGEHGNDYDLNPPTPPEGDRGGRPNAQVAAAMNWLAEYLAMGPAPAAATIDAAEASGHAKNTLYRARDALGVVAEGPRGRTLWRLPGGE